VKWAENWGPEPGRQHHEFNAAPTETDERFAFAFWGHYWTDGLHAGQLIKRLMKFGNWKRCTPIEILP